VTTPEWDACGFEYAAAMKRRMTRGRELTASFRGHPSPRLDCRRFSLVLILFIAKLLAHDRNGAFYGMYHKHTGETRDKMEGHSDRIKAVSV
jgi:hypothetical protein